MKRILTIAATGVVVLVAVGAVLVQQYGAWATADLERNVEEFTPSDTFESCLDEVDGVWLPWLVARARDLCADATGDS